MNFNVLVAKIGKKILNPKKKRHKKAKLEREVYYYGLITDVRLFNNTEELIISNQRVFYTFLHIFLPFNFIF